MKNIKSFSSRYLSLLLVIALVFSFGTNSFAATTKDDKEPGFSFWGEDSSGNKVDINNSKSFNIVVKATDPVNSDGTAGSGISYVSVDGAQLKYNEKKDVWDGVVLSFNPPFYVKNVNISVGDKAGNVSTSVVAMGGLENEYVNVNDVTSSGVKIIGMAKKFGNTSNNFVNSPTANIYYLLINDKMEASKGMVSNVLFTKNSAIDMVGTISLSTIPGLEDIFTNNKRGMIQVSFKDDLSVPSNGYYDSFYRINNIGAPNLELNCPEGWSSNAACSINAEDSDGIKELKYKLDNGSLTSIVGSETVVNITISGTHTLYVIATDNNGNISEKSASFKVDSDPVIIESTSMKYDKNTLKGELTMKFSDVLSGINKISYKLSSTSEYTDCVIKEDNSVIIMVPSGQTGNVYVMTEDKAGNKEVTEINVNTDFENPVINLQNESDKVITSAKNIIVDITDNNLAKISYSMNNSSEIKDIVVDDGTTKYSLPIDISIEGIHVIHLTATDKAGNISKKDITITFYKDAPILKGTNVKNGTTVTGSLEIVPDVQKTHGNVVKGYYKLKTGNWVEFKDKFYVSPPYSGNVEIKVEDEYGLVSNTIVVENLTIYDYSYSGPSYKISFDIGENGSVTYGGARIRSTYISKNSSATFKFVGDKGYVVDKITIDGKSIDRVDQYKFTKVTEKHQVTVTFRKEAAADNFSDLVGSAWYSRYVDYVYNNNLMIGTGKNFEPYISVTRAQLVEMLARMMNAEFTNKTSSKFVDVSKGTWYYNAVNWASDNDIVNGYGNGYFGPNDEVTLEQFVTILYRLDDGKHKGDSKVTFEKYSDTASWAKDAIDWAIKLNLLNGDSFNKFSPQKVLTRVEAAKILTLFSELKPVKK